MRRDSALKQHKCGRTHEEILEKKPKNLTVFKRKKTNEEIGRKKYGTEMGNKDLKIENFILDSLSLAPLSVFQ